VPERGSAERRYGRCFEPEERRSGKYCLSQPERWHQGCQVLGPASAWRPKTGLGLDGNGLSLETTLWPRPRVSRPRGLVYCNVLISYSVANNCQFQLNIGNPQLLL